VCELDRACAGAPFNPTLLQQPLQHCGAQSTANMRAALTPVQACSGKGPALPSSMLQVHSKGTKPGLTAGCHRVLRAVLDQQFPMNQRAAKLDGQSTREMVITGSREAQVLTISMAAAANWISAAAAKLTRARPSATPSSRRPPEGRQVRGERRRLREQSIQFAKVQPGSCDGDRRQ
jgi:hypothetical protein